MLKQEFDKITADYEKFGKTGSKDIKGAAPSGGLASAKNVKPLMNDKLKRRIFQKLGYKGYKKDELVPDEIF